MSELAPDADGPPVARLRADLRDAHERYERACDRVAAVGEAELERLRDAHGELTDLFARYEAEATGDGDFETFIEFQGQVATFIEGLPEDLRHRDAFEDVDDVLQQRRLTESDFERARSLLSPVRDDVARLDDRAEAREAYRDARLAVRQRREALRDRIDDLERLQRLGEADLDAPTERLRDPIERYNDAVTAAFETMRAEESAREVLEFVAETDAFPLVPFRSPPEDLLAYVREYEAGAEPIPQLLEYSDFSRSKLAHYVEHADALKRNVATQQTYLRRLDADPLTVDWPPPTADRLRYRCRELESVVRRVADEETVAALRTVRLLPRETEYRRLRESAVSRAQLDDSERERVASGAVADELAACREAVERLGEALDEHPGPDG